MRECFFRIIITYIKTNGLSRTILESNVSDSEITRLFKSIISKEDFVSFEKIHISESIYPHVSRAPFNEDENDSFYLSD
jgi:hypothetical protein